MDRLGKFFHELLESVNFEQCTHDDEHLWLSRDIRALHDTNIVAERMRLVIQYDCWSERTNTENTS